MLIFALENVMSKKIYDPVHGFIRFDALEHELITSIPYQRLYHIRQLGTAYLVYPGATHTRFEHSLGVMHIASSIYDHLFDYLETGKFPTHLQNTIEPHIPAKGSSEYAYWRRILRFAALCHDLGHLPFSHVAEKMMLDGDGHEGWTRKIMASEYLKPIWERCDPRRDVARDVIKIAIGPHKSDEPFSPWERVVSHMITGDFFGSDRIDYLLRDARATGLSYGLFDYQQLIEMIRILPALNPDHILQLGVEENGLESCEALLIARHYMHKRVYKYPAVKSYAHHMARFMQKAYKSHPFLQNIDDYIHMTDNEVLTEVNCARRDKNHIAHHDAIRLLQRKDHLDALPLDPSVNESKLFELMQMHKIAEDDIGWELTDHKQEGHSLPFPTLRRDGSIKEGSQLSQISINAPTIQWLYVAPKHRQELVRNL